MLRGVPRVDGEAALSEIGPMSIKPIRSTSIVRRLWPTLLSGDVSAHGRRQVDRSISSVR